MFKFIFSAIINYYCVVRHSAVGRYGDIVTHADISRTGTQLRFSCGLSAVHS